MSHPKPVFQAKQCVLPEESNLIVRFSVPVSLSVSCLICPRHYKLQPATKTWSKLEVTSWANLATSLRVTQGQGKLSWLGFCSATREGTYN